MGKIVTSGKTGTGLAEWYKIWLAKHFFIL